MKIKKNIKFIITISILSAVIAIVYLNYFGTPVHKPVTEKELPNQIGMWTAEEVPYDDVIQRVLGPDRIVYKEYKTSSGIAPVTLFMAYYNMLEKAELSHSPVVCLTGSGWDIQQVIKKKIVNNQAGGNTISVNEMIQKKQNATMIALFWYQSANHAFANRGLQKLMLFVNRLTGRPDQNAFVRLTIIVPENRSFEETRDNLYSFLNDLYPELNGFFL